MKKRLAALVAGGVLLGAAAFAVLIFPDNPLTNLFRRVVVDTGGKAIVGPYPNSKDFPVLKSRGITAIVTLLNPEMPYEAVLINRERILAESYGLKVLNFPMTSVLGQRFGDDYEANARKAAEAVAKESGRVYIHCYLGVHRAQFVVALLERSGVASGTYLVRQTSRAKDVRVLDSANDAFHQGKNDEVLAILAPPYDASSPAKALKGWALYRLGDSRSARDSFNEAIALDAKNIDAMIGLGYSLIRLDDVSGAEKSFSKAMDIAPKDAPSLAGMGIVRIHQGRNADAAVFLEKSLKIDPTNAEAKQLLAQVKTGAK